MSDEPEEGPDGPPAVWPLGLRAAFDRYEAALHADDIAVLERGPPGLDWGVLTSGHEFSSSPRVSAVVISCGGALD